MNIKEKLENLLDSMNDAYESVCIDSKEIQASVWNVYDLEYFFKENEIDTTFDAQDVICDIYFGYLNGNIDISYMTIILKDLIKELECKEEYEEFYYVLTDVQDNLDLNEIEIKDIDDYIDTLDRQINTVKEMISEL